MDLDSSPLTKKRKLIEIGDSKSFFTQIRRSLEQISSNNNLNQTDREKALNEIALMIIQLKRHSKESQDQTEELRILNEKKADSLGETIVTLNNLEYERSVIQAEIEMTKNNRQSQTIVEDRVSEQDYLQFAPKQLTTYSTEHEKMLNLFAFELQERKRFLIYFIFFILFILFFEKKIGWSFGRIKSTKKVN
jgi:hypothetical protein